MSPAVTPGGRLHSIVVGMPEAPAFFQYTCQCGAIFRCTPASNVVPGAAVSADSSRLACVVAARAPKQPRNAATKE